MGWGSLTPPHPHTSNPLPPLLYHIPAQVGVVHPAVVWGTAPGQLLHTAPATTFTYRREQLCGGVAAGKGWRDPGVFHSATLRGLAPGQPVWYKFGDVFGGWSPEYRFAAAPAPGAAVRLFAFGDLGQHQPDDSLQEGETPASRKTTDGMWREAQDKQLVLHVGDISYACGHEASWEHYHDQIQPLATRLPWMLLQVLCGGGGGGAEFCVTTQHLPRGGGGLTPPLPRTRISLWEKLKLYKR